MPTTSIAPPAPADSPLAEYKQYTFTASAVDPTVGRSIARYIWNFGDGTAIQTVDLASNTCVLAHRFQVAGTFTVRVTCVDDLGLAGTEAQVVVTVAVADTPVSVEATYPSVPTTFQVQTTQTVLVSYTLTATTSAAGATISSTSLTFDPGDTGFTPPPIVGTIVDNGNGNFTIPVTYTAASTAGNRTVQPTLFAFDSLGNTSAQISFQVVTISSTGVNHPPTVLITNPVTPSTSGFTSKPVSLGFTLADPDGDPLSYTVDWGDGSVPDAGSTGGSATLNGVSLGLTHRFADLFASGTHSSPNVATVTITANDQRGGVAPQTCVFNITYNTYPTGTITSPQASGTLPSLTDLPTGTGGVINPPGAQDPDLVVIPNGGQLAFNGAGTLPGSGDSQLTYTWDFSTHGSPQTASGANVPQVFFTGKLGEITSCLVTLTVTDAFQRPSSGAPGLNAKTYKKWVIVDGLHTQEFNLAFLYRQKSDNNGTPTLSTVQTAANGLGADVQIFQDGSSSAWPVGGVGTTNQASVAIPVRSNLPFYVQIPKFGTVDSLSYAMQIPNAPTGAFADPTLETVSPLPDTAEGFGFENASATAAPWWGPTLHIVTAQGFALESIDPPQRFLQGTTALVLGKTPANTRWVDRLSVPLTDGHAVQWEQDSNSVGEFSNVSAYQSFAEWPMVPLIQASKDVDGADLHSNTAGKPGDLGFNVNYATYANSDTQNSQSYLTTRLQAFRVPAAQGDPYYLTNGSATDWGTASCVADLHPTDLPATGAAGEVPRFFEGMIYGGPGATALSGGIQGFTVPYLVNDINRTPLTLAQTVGNRLFYNGIRSIFSYSEYLWSSVWVRPMVLNNANLNFMDSEPYWPAGTYGVGDPGNAGLRSYPYFRYSATDTWPRFVGSTGIPPDNSQFDLTAVGGGVFDASSPVAVNSVNPPSSKGVGRFFWTAYTPSYTSASGSVISRTWQATSGKVPPTTFTGDAVKDSTAALGFVPPQLMLVDKRGRNADGSLSGALLGGYRMTWYNPTVNASGNPVPPDFWVVELATSTGTVHFMLPGSFPSPTTLTSDTQTPNALVLTDARTYLPSYRTAAQGPALDGSGHVTDQVAPGSCWFDVPPELRPAAGTSATITVFALKAILANNHVLGARALNRTDWIDAIKTATAQIAVVPGSNLSYAHKIPFNYPWDIVVVNGPATPVAP